MKRSKLNTMAAGLALVSALSIGLPATAQYKFETPTGHQTVAPSQMPQQPMIYQENLKGTTIHVGNLQFPAGIGAQRQQGPQYYTPVWVRAALTVWMLFIAALAVLVAAELQWRFDVTEPERRGHIIREDYIEEPLHRQRSAEL